MAEPVRFFAVRLRVVSDLAPAPVRFVGCLAEALVFEAARRLGERLRAVAFFCRRLFFRFFVGASWMEGMFTSGVRADSRAAACAIEGAGAVPRTTGAFVGATRHQMPVETGAWAPSPRSCGPGAARAKIPRYGGLP